MRCVIEALDSGVGNAVIRILDADGVLLAAIDLHKPSFAEADPDSIVMVDTPRSAIAEANGQAATARVHDGNGAVQVSSLAVGVTSGDIRLNSVDFVSGQTITITSGLIRHP